MEEPSARAEKTADRPTDGSDDVSDDEENLITEPPEFFDDEADLANEDWAKKQRAGHTSDAILSCPACFTSLCVDCQRHEKYVIQFRAMFVRNCRVIEDEVLRMPPERPKGQKKRNSRKQRVNVENEKGETNLHHENHSEVEVNVDLPCGELYKSVCCAECGTQVAVIDSEEVYHFFNTLPSYS